MYEQSKPEVKVKQVETALSDLESQLEDLVFLISELEKCIAVSLQKLEIDDGTPKSNVAKGLVSTGCDLADRIYDSYRKVHDSNKYLRYLIKQCQLPMTTC